MGFQAREERKEMRRKEDEACDRRIVVFVEA
jgi:hypothetical protein